MTNLNDHSNRAHALLSASSAHRWLNCPPSAIAATAYEDEGSEFAAEGTLAHEVAELFARVQVIDGHPDQTVVPASCTSDAEAVTAEMQDCARDYADYIQEHIKSPDAVVLLEQRVDFSPWVPEGFGTCDCIILQDDTMTVIDYKFGKGVAVEAVNNPQLRLYALGALNDFGIAYDVTKVETHIFQPRINNVDSEAMTADELLAWGDSIKPIAQKAAKGKGTYKAGIHCKFCPHAGKCRALTALCTEKVEAYGISAKVPTLAPHEVAEVLQLEPIFNIWLKNVKAQALQTLLDGGDIPGFKVVEGKLGNRKWKDELEALNALLCSGYAKEDVTETKLLSPAGMDKAIGKKKVAELLESLIDRAPGAPTIAAATDKRPVYDRLAEAQKDFN
jgi:hypothetical protein